MKPTGRTPAADRVASALVVCALASGARSHATMADGQPQTWPTNYDVVWAERREWSGAGALGSMPIGSGMTGANVWADDTALRLLLAHTDSYDEYYLLMKLGQIAIELDPNPFAPLAQPPPSPSPPFHGNRSSVASYTEATNTIGCASASGCVDPHDPRCASLALSPLPLIFSHRSEKSVCGAAPCEFLSARARPHALPRLRQRVVAGRTAQASASATSGALAPQRSCLRAHGRWATPAGGGTAGS